MVLDKFPPILEFGEYKYYSYCPACGCVANYKISYNYTCVHASEKYRVYGWVCLECDSEHCFNKYNIMIKDYMGVSDVTLQY